jgi:glucans biosynthesis protein
MPRPDRNALSAGAFVLVVLRGRAPGQNDAGELAPSRSVSLRGAVRRDGKSSRVANDPMTDRLRKPARRGVLAGLAALPFSGAWAGRAPAEEIPRRPAQAPGRLPRFGPRAPFRHEHVVARAQALARQPYRPPAERYSEALARIGYDAHQQIKMRRALAPRTKTSPVAIDLFHLANFFRLPVAVHLVEAGSAREILYDRDLFAFGEEARFAADFPEDLGFAGFRLRNADTWKEWLAFLGSSYFRSPGEEGQFGLSARGLAVDTAMPGGEEFPRFSAFWLAPQAGRADRLTIHALLEGPRVAGAYRMSAAHARGTIMEVEAALFLRGDIGRLGLAPLTSMFWYGKHNRLTGRDWRPEVHDSDGLALWTAEGERIWRPLGNPPRPQVSAFPGRAPKGFGLMQRERRFSQYEDPLVLYDKRPSLWVEPLGDWGDGAVTLVELPAASEFNDNIVAFWVPQRPATAGSALRLAYRLHWLSDEPYPSAAARVTATRTGRSGVHDRRSTKFAVDFTGGRLGGIAPRADGKSDLEFAVSAPRGRIERNHVMRVDDTRWRAIFEYAPVDTEPVDLSGVLRRGGEPLGETWRFRFIPRD